MTNDKEVDQKTLARAKEYVALLEAGDNEKAAEVFNELAESRESQLFNELGRLTRNFHETMNAFNNDDRINSIASSEMSDAKERLNFVIKKTDESAHTTLNAVETALPICDSLDKTLSDLNEAWEKFLSKEMNAAEFRKLSTTMKTFFNTSNDDLTAVRTNLTTILMAQDFQDITGQIIKRVITLVSEVEESLVELIRLGSSLNLPGMEKMEEKTPKKNESTLDGPQVPGVKSEGAVNGQDDVDDLLSSLGF